MFSLSYLTLIIFCALLLLLYIAAKKSYALFAKEKVSLQSLENDLNEYKLKLANETEYFRFSKLILLKNDLIGIKDRILKIRHILLRRRVQASLKAINQIENNLENERSQINARFLKNEKIRCKSLFYDNSGKALLTDEQMEAVLVDDDRNLIIAGAGSGKTRVIDFKVRYLVQYKNVDPKRIILLSFSKKSANDLIEKISKNVVGIEARTIHSFSSSIFKNQGKTLFDEKNKQMELFIIKALVDTLKDAASLRNFKSFYENYFSIVKSFIFYNSLSDLRADLKKINARIDEEDDQFEEIKLKKTFKTLKGDYVRSIDERYIADFLYIQNINYEYEVRYPHSESIYYPDFYLVDYDIYFEHFAITKDGTPPPYFSKPQKYLEGMEWKRQEHKKHNTKMIESFSFELNEKGTDDYLGQLLKTNGIKLEMKVDEERLYGAISQEFSRFFNRFYSSYKLTGFSVADLKERFPDLRFTSFLKFFESFLIHYERLVQKERKMDYSDMIINAFENSRKNPVPHFDYIIVDEFQDTSNLSMKLLNSVYQSNPKSAFFSVGDDWQSIYGFNGSDVSILSEYENSYQGVAVKNLNSNFRSHAKIVELGKRFVSKNPAQISKNVVSGNTQLNKSEIDFISFSLMEDKIKSIPDHESIFILYRYNDDCPAGRGIFEEYFEFTRDRKPIKRKGCKKNISLMTIHGSKGLEAKHVFVLFPEGVKRKFPSEIEDHFVFSMLKNNSDEFPFSEERRLMYVAITRAEQNLYFVSQKIKEPQSVFWDELRELSKF